MVIVSTRCGVLYSAFHKALLKFVVEADSSASAYFRKEVSSTSCWVREKGAPVYFKKRRWLFASGEDVSLRLVLQFKKIYP